MATRFKSVIAFLAAVAVVATLACAGDPPVPTPNIEATVEARLAEERAVNATVEAKLATPFPTYTFAPTSTPRPKPRVGVTKAKYLQIHEGMSYAQVARIIGAPGEEMSRSTIAGYTTVMYQWVNNDYSSMNAMFQNGGLITKAQFGLR